MLNNFVKLSFLLLLFFIVFKISLSDNEKNRIIELIIEEISIEYIISGI